MIMPQRIQLRRFAGWRLQEVSLALNGLPAKSITRPGLYGNPCVCSRPFGCPYSPHFERKQWADKKGEIHPLRCCVDTYQHYVETGLAGAETCTGRFWFAAEGMDGYPHRKRLIAALPALRGHNLACACALDERCHGDVLLKYANPKPMS